MNPEDGPAELVQKAARAMADDWNPDRDPILTAMFRDYAASALAAVLPDIQVQALRDAAYALRTDEAAYGGNRAVLGPPEGASWLLRRAARLTDTSEGEEK